MDGRGASAWPRGRRRWKGGAAGEGDGGVGEGRIRGGWPSLRLVITVLACLICDASGWIALSKDGFRVTKELSLNNGTIIEGDVLVNGVIHSSDYTWLGPTVDDVDLCDHTRDGSLRWNANTGDFEGCEASSGDWNAVRFCSKDCGFSHMPQQRLRNASQGGPVDCDSVAIAQLDGDATALNESARENVSFCSDAMLEFDGWASQLAFADSRMFRMGLPDGKTQHFACGTEPKDIRNKLIVVLYEDAANPQLMSSIVELGNIHDEVPRRVVWFREGARSEEIESFCAGQIVLQSVPVVSPWTDARLESSTPQNAPPQPELNLAPTNCSLYDLQGPAFDYLRIFYNLSGWESLLPPGPPAPVRLRVFSNESLVGNYSNATHVAALLGDLDPSAQELLDLCSGSHQPLLDICTGNLINDGTEVNVTQLLRDVSSHQNGSALEQLLRSLDRKRSRFGEEEWDSILNKTALPECTDNTVHPLWHSFVRGVDEHGAHGIFKSGPLSTFQVGNDTFPGGCLVRIYAPMGYKLRLSFLELDLGEDEVFEVREMGEGGMEQGEVDDEGRIKHVDYGPALDGHRHMWTTNTSLPLVTSRRFGSWMEIFYNQSASVARNSTGYILAYDYVSRGSLLVQDKRSTSLQYTMALLEVQGANMRRFGWTNWSGSSEVEVPGFLGLGAVTQAEQCFVCCVLGQDYDVAGDYVREQYRQAHLEGAPILPSWTARPQQADVGASGNLSANFSMTVDLEEIPSLARYMGYLPQHFVRSDYISRFPPGSIKASYGSPLGKRTNWTVQGYADPSLHSNVNRPREEVGWGMDRIMVHRGGNFSDRDSHGWKGGWGDGTLAGQGTSWRDFDGANAQWFPAWQIVAPAGNLVVDGLRWDLDLDHEDAALFSFVDKNKRIVFANDLALSIACHVKVNNTCGVGCEVLGTGLNMLQCIANINKTVCSQPVVDDCNNECGMRGSLECDVSARGVGVVRLHSKVNVSSTADFQVSVGLQRDANDSLVRLEDRTHSEIQPGTLFEGGWATVARPFPASDGTDNSLYLSYHDPVEDVDFETELFGKSVRLTLTASQVDLLHAKVAFDMPLPIECLGDPSACELYKMSVVDEVRVGLRWVNVAEVPHWDRGYENKLADFLEVEAIVARNREVLELLFIADCLGVPDANCNQGDYRLREKLFRMYAQITETGLPCAQALSASMCVMTVDNMQFMLTDLEARRTEMMHIVNSRPKFHMAKINRLGGPGGLDFASPDPTLNRTYNHNTNTMRISTDLELVGDYVRIGASRYVKNYTQCHYREVEVPCGDAKPSSGRGRDISGMDVADSGWVFSVTPYLETCPEQDPDLCFAGGLCDLTNCSWSLDLDQATVSHVFFDGEIEKECPFAFNGGSDKGGKLRWCVETQRTAPLTQDWEKPIVDPLSPNTNSRDRVITLPDASGRVLLSTQLTDIKNLRGLRKRSSFTPYKYSVSSLLTLDSDRDMPGQTFWNKKFGAPSGVCGHFDDGVEIACPPLKLHFDSVESSQDSLDEAFIFTGTDILQGARVSTSPYPMMPEARLECLDVQKMPNNATNGTCNSTREGIGGITLVSKKMYICINFAGRLVGTSVRPCDPFSADALPCPSGQRCSRYPIWDFLMEERHPEGFNLIAQIETMLPVTYAIDVDFDQATPKTCIEAADITRMEASMFAFLQIYNGMDLAPVLVEHMQAQQELYGITPVSSDRPLHLLALEYLDMQGVEEIVWGSGSIVVADALRDSTVETFQPWGSSLLELCVVCCANIDYAEDMEVRLLDVPAVNDTDCPWLNVSNLMGKDLEGAYQLQNYTSHDHPVWKQEPGDVYIYLLAHACTDYGLCGTTLEEAAVLRGPAWVAGPVVGSSRFSFYVKTTTTPFDLLPFMLLDSYEKEINLPFSTVTQIIGTFIPVWRQLLLNGTLSIFTPELRCSQTPIYRFATTAVDFKDPTAHRKLTIPDVSGNLVTTGTLDEITSVGVLVSPIIGQNSDSHSTRIKFGTGWQTVNITSGVNDGIDLTWSAGGFSYCTAPKAACQLPSTIGPFVRLNNIDGCPLPLAPESLQGCMYLPQVNTTTNGRVHWGHGVEAILLPHKDNTQCASLYLTAEHLTGPGSFEEMLTTRCSMEEAEGDPLPTNAIDAAAEVLPKYWGIDVEECRTLNLACKALLLDGCKNACFRQRTCTHFRLDTVNWECDLFQDGCNEVPDAEAGSRYFRKTDGAWEPQRIFGSDVNYFPEVGSEIVLQHTPLRKWSVRGIYTLCDRDPLGTDSSKCFGRTLPLPITTNLTSRTRYELCTTDDEGTGVGDNAGWTTLHTPLPLSYSSQGVVTAQVKNSSFDLYSFIRIADDVFQVLGGSYNSETRIGTLSIQRSPASPMPESHDAGARVLGVEGGEWNTTWLRSPRIAPGIYTLENISETLNTAIETVLVGREVRASVEIRHPNDGLCGEVKPGSSYMPDKFHCAPASRFMQLTGGLRPGILNAPNNNIRILNTSSLLNTLGIATPVSAYTFANWQNTTFPSSKARQHPVLEGAGFISSGYGPDSGYGAGGQDAWTGYKPPGADEVMPIDALFWCEDGPGHRCNHEPCVCTMPPVATYAAVLGSTKASDGSDPVDNVLLIPRGSDGVIVSTGNLEDIGLDSAPLSGLRIDALREHATATAARVHGKVEFGRCNSLFGDWPECSADSLEGGISLDKSGGKLSIHTFWKHTVWAAVYASKEHAIQAAASKRDYLAFWRHFPGSRASVNRTYSALQDPSSMRVAGRLCKTYCADLVEKQDAEAADASQRWAVIEQAGMQSVSSLLADTAEYCSDVRCPITGTVYPTADGEGNSSATLCINECPLDGEGLSPCECSLAKTCADVWDGAEETFQGNMEVWRLCIRLLDNHYRLNTLLPGLLTRANNELAKYELVSENLGLIALRDEQVAEAELECTCVEVPGESVEVLENVTQHRCPEYLMLEVDDEGFHLNPPQNVSAKVCLSEKPEYLRLGANGTSSTTVLDFLSEGPAVSYLTLPFASGVLLTSGNLHSVTAQSGAMTSVHVKGHSDFLSGLSIGTVHGKAKSRGSRVGGGNRTSIHQDVTAHCEACTVSGTCDLCLDPDSIVTLNKSFIAIQAAGNSSIPGGKTRLTFEAAQGAWEILFPAWDGNLCANSVDRQSCEERNMTSGLASMTGRVITTGNLEDISHLNPDTVVSGGTLSLTGEVELGASYDCSTTRNPLSGWSAHTQASCLEVGSFAWNSSDVVSLNVSACKKACEAEPRCGVALVQSARDRSEPNPRCLLVERRATQCTVASKPGIDLYLLYRQGPSPWLTQQGNTPFFEKMCRDKLNNVSSIPTSSVRFNGFINGEIMYRKSVPMTWTSHPNMTCAAFEGKIPEILRKLNFTVEEVEAPPITVPNVTFNASNMSNISSAGNVTSNSSNFSNFTDFATPEPSPVNITTITVEYCKQQCELDPACKIVTISHLDNQCWLMQGVVDRRVLPDWSVIQGACWLEPSIDFDVHEIVRNESIRLTFDAPTDVRSLTFADTSGTIITSGNTYDIRENVGLAGDDTISFYHKPTVAPQRLLDQSAAISLVRSPDELWSFASEREKGLIVRNCDRFDGCRLIASDSIDNATLQAYIEEHITTRVFLLDQNMVEQGSGDGFDSYRTIVDVAEPGSRTGDAECGLGCRGRLPCQRGTPTCHSQCPGWRLPSQRKGITVDDYCLDPNVVSELNAKGDRCGCVGGYGYGKFGTAVCVMPDEAHPMHGAFCENTTADGTTYKMENVTCCSDPATASECGICTAFPPLMAYGKENRITFPEATGVVLTTGNIDSLTLTDVQLEGLDMDGPINFGVQNIDSDKRPKMGYPEGFYSEVVNGMVIYRSLIDFDPPTSYVTGGFRMVAGYGDPGLRYGTTLLPGTGQVGPVTYLNAAPHTPFEATTVEELPEYQQRFCVESKPYGPYKTMNSLMQEDTSNPSRCFTKREILLPDASGQIITTGNLEELPSMAVPRDGLFVEGTTGKFEVFGNLTLGRRVNYAEDPSNNRDASDNGRRSILSMHATIDGDVGLTFQSASDYMPHWTIHREIDDMANYSKYGLGTPFGGSAPTDDVARFGREGREKPTRTRLWGGDTTRLNPAVLGGVDVAIREYLRDGSPSLAVTVSDEFSLTGGPPGSLRDNFGYLSGRPVLQQRPGQLPSIKHTYLPYNADVPSFIGNSAVQGTVPINAGYCRDRMLEVDEVDMANNERGVSYYHRFSDHLVKRNLVVPTLIEGLVLGPPAYDPAILEGTRLGSESCQVLANATRRILEGQGTMLSSPSTRVVNATARLLRYTSSSQVYEEGIECKPLSWNDLAIEADFVRYEQTTCEGGTQGETVRDVLSADECAMACLRYGSQCKGYTTVSELRHRARGIFGDCTLSIGRCDPAPIVGDTGVTEIFVDQMMTVLEESIPRTRSCATDFDFSSADFDGLRAEAGITSGAGGSGASGPLSDAEGCYACCQLRVPQEEMTGRGVDGDLGTSLDYFDGNGCLLVLDVGIGVSKAVRTIRFAPRPGYSHRMVGGRFQGSNTSWEGSNTSWDESFEDLHVVEQPPREGVYTDVEVPYSGWYRYLRYLAPHDSFCSVAELEFHSATFPRLSPVQAGITSYWVNHTALVADARAAELVKCAAHGMIPAWLENDRQEVVLPEANGQALTTGSLSDITIKSGLMSSVSVAGDLSVGGSSIIGSSSNGESSLVINSQLVGESVFRFQGDAGRDKAFAGGVLDVGVLKTPGDKFVQMPDSSGTVVVGELPPVMKGMLMLPDGGLDMTWTVALGADTLIKSSGPDSSASLQINSALLGSFPLSFDGSVRGPAQTSVSSPEPTIDSVVTFPDASGTILTSGSIPSVLSNITSINGASMQGGAKFLDGDVVIGEADMPVNLDIYAHILGANSLIFDGSSSKDGRTLVLSADDPQGENHLTLPDASGTIITSGNFPSVFDSLRAIGNLSVTGSTSLDARRIRIGVPGGNTRLSLPATIRGAFPLVFDGGLAADDESGGAPERTTVLMMPESSRDNVITLPDTSGDVVTTTTMPTRLVTGSEYRVSARTLVLSSDSISLGRPCTGEADVDAPAGSFTYYDSTAGAAGFRPMGDNMFMAHAAGGFRFVTGRTTKGRLTGAVLRPNASAWSYLSDKTAKTSFQPVNATLVLETLIRSVPAYTWSYSGGGDNSTHMGCMAQDLYDAFGLGDDRSMIGTSDMDGVLMGAAQGMDIKVRSVESEISSHEKALAEQGRILEEQRRRLQAQQVTRAKQAQRLKALLEAVAARAPAVA